jgi:succinoglycan biosynthesis protein ExoA
MTNSRSVLQTETSIDPDTQPNEVLIVIPALNEAKHIERCLSSLIDGDKFVEGALIVVADGGSTDESQAIVHRLMHQYQNLRLAANPKRFQSAGINAAVAKFAEAQHLFLVRCDAHSVYPKNYVRNVIEAFSRNPQAASVATVMDAKGSSCFQRAVAWIVDTPVGSGGSAHRGGTKSGWVDHGHHAGFRLDWFKRIGGYDPQFTHNEDAEYDHRLHDAGGRIWLETGIRFQYHMRPTPRKLFHQYWSYGKGRARTLIKHRMKPRLRQIIPVINLILLIGCLLLAPIWATLLYWPLVYGSILLAASCLTSIKMWSFCGMWAGVGLAIMHNAWAAGFLRNLAIHVFDQSKS